MTTDARKSSRMPALLSRIVTPGAAAQAGAILTIVLGWFCLYFAVTQSLLME